MSFVGFCSLHVGNINHLIQNVVHSIHCHGILSPTINFLHAAYGIEKLDVEVIQREGETSWRPRSLRLLVQKVENIPRNTCCRMECCKCNVIESNFEASS